MGIKYAGTRGSNGINSSGSFQNMSAPVFPPNKKLLALLLPSAISREGHFPHLMKVGFIHEYEVETSNSSVWGGLFSLLLISLSEISGAGSAFAGKPAICRKFNLRECQVSLLDNMP